MPAASSPVRPKASDLLAARNIVAFLNQALGQMPVHGDASRAPPVNAVVNSNLVAIHGLEIGFQNAPRGSCNHRRPFAGNDVNTRMQRWRRVST